MCSESKLIVKSSMLCTLKKEAIKDVVSRIFPITLRKVLTSDMIEAGFHNTGVVPYSRSIINEHANEVFGHIEIVRERKLSNDQQLKKSLNFMLPHLTLYQI
jgi:hypothetical protein